jgi:hypothetical protein
MRLIRPGGPFAHRTCLGDEDWGLTLFNRQLKNTCEDCGIWPQATAIVIGGAPWEGGGIGKGGIEFGTPWLHVAGDSLTPWSSPPASASQSAGLLADRWWLPG